MNDFLNKSPKKTAFRRTDLASELVRSNTVDLDEWISICTVNVSKKASLRLGKPPGKYTTVLSPVVKLGKTELYSRLAEVLADEIKKCVRSTRDCLVVGLGNPNMTADALGAKVAQKIVITRSAGSRGVCTLTPFVSALTGVESFESVLGVVSQIKPSCVIAVDSLCSAHESRLCTAFQVSNVGIVPGSGVGNHRQPINKTTIGVPVVSIGVPLVVYATTLVENAGGNPQKTDPDLVVAPKDIDALVEDCAVVIANAINIVFAGK